MGISRRLALITLVALAGCDRKSVSPAAKAEGVAAYQAPPAVNAAAAAPGGVRLTGQAGAGAMVRFRAPEGDHLEARAGADGGWSVTLPAAASPRLYAFEAELGGRVLKGDGALAVIGAPAPLALVLRAGYAAEIAGDGAPGALRLVALDYDGGGVAAAGFAPTNTPIRLVVDGAVLGVAAADRRGRFAILAVDPRHRAAPGAHRVAVQTQSGLMVERTVRVAAPTLPPGQPYRAEAEPGGWAITWALPGGGAETCRVFTDAVGAPRS